jgi:ABC-type polysaccharide/polyol phosphate export permease
MHSESAGGPQDPCVCQDFGIATRLFLRIPGIKLFEHPDSLISIFGCWILCAGKSRLVLELKDDIWSCSYCGQNFPSLRDLYNGRLSGLLAVINLWMIICIRQISFETRLGSKWPFIRSIGSWFVYITFFLFSGTLDSVPNPDTLVMMVTLWTLFEIGISRTILSLNMFSRLATRTKSSPLVVSSSCFLSTLVDLIVLLICCSLFTAWHPDIEIITVGNLILFLIAYLLLVIPSLVIAFFLSWLSRNYRDLKHALPWILRIMMLFTPIFHQALPERLNIVKNLAVLFPINLPFNILQTAQNKTTYFYFEQTFTYIAISLLFAYLLYSRNGIRWKIEN